MRCWCTRLRIAGGPARPPRALAIKDSRRWGHRGGLGMREGRPRRDRPHDPAPPLPLRRSRTAQERWSGCMQLPCGLPAWHDGPSAHPGGRGRGRLSSVTVVGRAHPSSRFATPCRAVTRTGRLPCGRGRIDKRWATERALQRVSRVRVLGVVCSAWRRHPASQADPTSQADPRHLSKCALEGTVCRLLSGLVRIRVRPPKREGLRAGIPDRLWDKGAAAPTPSV